MRSLMPKVLHEICGRPMILWPVAAAQQAGAGRVVVVDSPARALAAALPEHVELAVQSSPDGTGGAVAAALEYLGSAGEDSDEPVVVLSGDVPLVSESLISGLIATHRGAGAAATIVTAHLEDPSGYGRVVRRADGTVERIVETKRDGDATAKELEIDEVNAGIYAFAAGEL